MSAAKIGSELEAVYESFNKREFVHPDPLEFLYEYPDPKDREIVGLVASSLAYGKVVSILKSVSRVLEFMGPSPGSFLEYSSNESIKKDCAGFVHRFAKDGHLYAMLAGAKGCVEKYGSLYECFLSGHGKNDENTLPALSRFTDEIMKHAKGNPGHLLPSPKRGSACKRLYLFLRWMVRKDAVDPGGWDEISPSKLIVPVDVHMHRISLKLGFTARKNADMRTALEITEGFRNIVPEDPVRYDFALTRFGIRDDFGINDLFDSFEDKLKADL